MVWQQEHRLVYEDFLERYKIAVLCFLGLFLFLSLRLFYLQVLRGRFYHTISEQQRTHVLIERAPRGTIFDRKGNVIVGNRTSFVALFYPFTQNSVPNREVLDQLKVILPAKDINASLVQGWRRGKVMRLASDLSRPEMFKLQEQRLVAPGISVVKESQRDYRAPVYNSHLIGYLGEITQKEIEDLEEEGYKSGDWMGRGGLEQSFNGYLRGQDGGWQIEVDALGHQTRLVRHIAPQKGSDLQTTIDADLQDVAGAALAASPSGRGACVAIDPRTGAVRALVSSPGFDPNDALSKQFLQYLRDRRLPLFNRTVQGLYPPGSTFKIVTFIAALTEGHVDPSLTHYCEGKFTLGNKTFGCWFKKGHGYMNLMTGFMNSCNVYFYQTGLRVGPRAIEKYAREFLLGEKTGIGIPSEKKGLVPSHEWKLKKMKESWQQGDTVNIAIGQGPVWVTPFQMAQLTAAVANKGVMYQPYIVEKVTTPKGEIVFEAKPQKKKEILLPDRVWTLLHAALKQVVTDGTGRGCLIPGLPVAGKTGTAQNPHGEDHAWFVAYAPADDPQLALAVIVENGGHGGTAAVPVAKKVFETAFGISVSTGTPAVTRTVVRSTDTATAQPAVAVH